MQHPSPRRSVNIVGVCLGGIRCPGSARTLWVSVWVASNGAAGEELPSNKQSENVVDVWGIYWRWRSAASVQKHCGCLSGWHSLPRQSENVVGVCLGGIRCPDSPRTSWCLSGWHSLPRQSENVMGVCLGGIRCPSSPRTSWVSVWVAFVAQAVREHCGCLSGCHAMELPSTKQSENVVDVCLGCIHRRWRSAASVAQAVQKHRGCLSGWHSLPRQSENVVGVCLGGIHCPGSPRTSWCLSGWHSLPRQSENVMGVCLGGICCPSSPRTSWVSVWVAFVAQAVRERCGCLSGCHAMELPSTKQSENVVDVCLGCIHRRWRNAASVAQAVQKHRGCLSGWHSLPRQSENVVGVCLGGLQWSCRRGSSFNQAV